MEKPSDTLPTAGAGGVAPERSDAQRVAMNCRPDCGACCIAPSISSPIPGMPQGKRAGEKCVQLTADFRCALFGRPERPAVCLSLRPTEEMCGVSRMEAMQRLDALELATAPASGLSAN